MTPQTFNQIVNEQIEQCQSILVDRSKQYATGEDRLSNIRRAASLQKTSMRKTVGGLLVKPIVSLFDWLDEEDLENRTYEDWQEKITDSINYLLILGCVLHEEDINNFLTRTSDK